MLILDKLFLKHERASPFHVSWGREGGGEVVRLTPPRKNYPQKAQPY